MLLEVRIRAPCLKPAVNTPVFSRHNACQVLDASAIIDAFLLTDVCARFGRGGLARASLGLPEME